MRPARRAETSAVLVASNVRVRMEAQHSVPHPPFLSLRDLLRESFTFTGLCYHFGLSAIDGLCYHFGLSVIDGLSCHFGLSAIDGLCYHFGLSAIDGLC